MTDVKNYRLTGGVFFLLVTRGLKKIGKTEIDCLIDLVAIFDKSKKYVSRKTMRSNTTQYKKCELDNSMFLPFSDENLREAFRSRLEHDYASVLAEMSAFVEKFVPKSDYSWLVSAIDEILRNDSSVRNAQFHILQSGEAVSYKELLDEDEVEIEPFLTGIWGFILTERPLNSDGAATFHALTSVAETKGNPHPFISDIGKALQKKAVSMDPDSENVTQRRYIMPGSSVAPEVTPDGELYLVEEVLSDDEEAEYEEYFNHLKKDYNRITTLLYADIPQPFYDFYVCNNMYRIEAGRDKKRITVKNATVDALIEHSNYVLLSGNGGLGKSMMMRHLLLDCINRYEEIGLLPIFLELRTYTETEQSLADYAYRLFAKNGGNKSREEFEVLLKSGDILLLCDGLDEVKSEKRQRFQQELEEYAASYPESVIIISSRPFGPFASHASLKRFTVFYLQAFSEDQAVELVNKLRFHEEKPEIKQKFLVALKRLYWTHHSFAENPLLLTIMMMMYADIGDVPSEMHRFYNEAFQVLARKHDATKGGYKRPLATQLDVEDFKKLFAEFCARTYNDERVELTDEQMESYYGQLKAVKELSAHWNYESFAEDLTSNLCLMYYESLMYHFVHRSFQEYFCARYLADRLDRNLYRLSLTFFESKHYRYYSDNTFELLYDMDPIRIEDNVFLPFLKDLFEKCDKDGGYGYLNFLRIMYPEIAYNHGTVSSDSETEAKSFLYKFIILKAGIDFTISNDDFPYEHDFVEETYVELDEDWVERTDSSDDTIVRKDDVDPEYWDEYGMPNDVGYNLAFEVETVVNNAESYQEFFDRLFDDDFALKKEYDEVREYYRKLNQRHSDQPDEDVFDLL